MEGSWYYFDNEYVYHELYFTDSLFTYNLESHVGNQVQNYVIENDKIYTGSIPVATSNNNVFFKIDRFTTDSVIIIMNINTFTLKRVCLNYNIFNAELNMNLQNRLFMNRAENAKIITGIKEDADFDYSGEYDIMTEEDNIL